MLSFAELGAFAFPLVAGVIHIAFKWHLDTTSTRQAKYRFAKEFFSDFRQDTSIQHSMQLVAGYEALGGSYWRPIDEIRHVLEISHREPGIIVIHRRATLQNLRFNSYEGYIDWSGLFKSPWVRSFIEVAYTVWFVVGLSLCTFFIDQLLKSKIPVTSANFWLIGIYLVLIFGATACLALIVVLKIDQSNLLIQKSKGEQPEEWHVTRAWRVIRGASLRLWNRIDI